MYDQKVDDGIPRRKGDDSPVAGARIIIRPYLDLLSAEIKTQTSEETEKLALTFQNTTTKDISEAAYDAVVCATGYERQSWLNLLKSSNIGRRFGLSSVTDKVSLGVERDFTAAMKGSNGHSRALASALKKQGMREAYMESGECGMSRTFQTALIVLTRHDVP